MGIPFLGRRMSPVQEEEKKEYPPSPSEVFFDLMKVEEGGERRGVGPRVSSWEAVQDVARSYVLEGGSWEGLEVEVLFFFRLRPEEKERHSSRGGVFNLAGERVR